MYGSETVGKVIKKGDIVVYESTVYPGVIWYRHNPCWEGLKPIRENIEYTISRNSDVVGPTSSHSEQRS